MPGASQSHAARPSGALSLATCPLPVVGVGSWRARQECSHLKARCPQDLTGHVGAGAEAIGPTLASSTHAFPSKSLCSLRGVRTGPWEAAACSQTPRGWMSGPPASGGHPRLPAVAVQQRTGFHGGQQGLSQVASRMHMRVSVCRGWIGVPGGRQQSPGGVRVSSGMTASERPIFVLTSLARLSTRTVCPRRASRTPQARQSAQEAARVPAPRARMSREPGEPPRPAGQPSPARPGTDWCSGHTPPQHPPAPWCPPHLQTVPVLWWPPRVPHHRGSRACAQAPAGVQLPCQGTSACRRLGVAVHLGHLGPIAPGPGETLGAEATCRSQERSRAPGRALGGGRSSCAGRAGAGAASRSQSLSWSRRHRP